ncbi:glycosyl transferase, group 1 [Roseibacterium elongatum DSM 19469]|uniref:Glycosyl transferase, group 1 n=1 Tax=Roseicyclus elongatus DSM 19469 TaxID=1294273 RepID=W8RQM3_9RHOB|nr:glycosyl transferase, group 1 [Roseibacterium elongatum DSM 19469]
MDVTRLLTRVGRGALSGIDRVELAYAEQLLTETPKARFLCRTTRGYLLLGPDGAACLLSMVKGDTPLGQADAWSRWTGRGQRPRHRAEAALRPFALDRSAHGALARLLARQRVKPIAYLNTGHSNLTRQTLAPLRSSGVRVAILVHDIIPIRHPEFGPPKQAGSFTIKLTNVASFADLVICNSHDTQRQLSDLWRGREPCPRTLVAHLGLTPMPRIAGVARDPARFVMLGTIEPRKNHALVLQAWRLLADSLPDTHMPELHIIGAPGWQSSRIIATIRAHPLFGRKIHLHGALPDTEVAAHLAAASALLYPSHAEGFGLPPIEALAQGALPICADLAVLREVLGQHVVYLTPNDAYPWSETIKKRISGNLTAPVGTVYDFPDWQDHFSLVASALGSKDAAEQEGTE